MQELAAQFIESIPDPDRVQKELVESIRKTDLLRAVLRVARRKAAHDRGRIAKADSQAIATESVVCRG